MKFRKAVPYMIDFLERQIAVIQRENCFYPEKDDAFSPSQMYLEYPFGEKTLAAHKNMVYEMVRNGFLMLGLDEEKAGTPEWNPLGEFIKQGDYVLLKPNMVLDENHIKENGTECLITHPSVIRAVLDFVVIALKGTGHIVVGDAPLQSCNFERLVNKHGIKDIICFYKRQMIDIDLLDFRMVTSQVRNSFVEVIKTKEASGCTAVNLGNISEHQNNDGKRLRVTSYDPDEMEKHHNAAKHEYLIAKTVLSADVVINLPKPKTHRKAGMTGALKNLIGINGNKDWLPHHKKGAKTEGGDEYLNRNLFKKAQADIQDMINRKIKEKRCPKQLRTVSRILSLAGRVTSPDSYSEGSWYGNDTIWRTIADLNRILLYCDKNGVLKKEVQRKVFVIGDMIIAGEGEGPLMPMPVKKGILIFGCNPAAFDTVAAEIMGFDYEKIPSIYKAYHKNAYPLIDFERTDIILKEDYEYKSKHAGSFLPSSGWKGHIEKNGEKNQMYRLP